MTDMEIVVFTLTIGIILAVGGIILDKESKGRFPDLSFAMVCAGLVFILANVVVFITVLLTWPHGVNGLT